MKLLLFRRWANILGDVLGEAIIVCDSGNCWDEKEAANKKKMQGGLRYGNWGGREEVIL